jgi:hypothetical protein
VEWLKVKALSSSPNTTNKQTNKKIRRGKKKKRKYPTQKGIVPV